MRTIAVAAAAALTLVVVYLALGGASYAPAKVADPCAQRVWRNPEGLEKTVEQIVLSALDGVACELGVSREKVVLALANRDSQRRFAREHGISERRLEQLVRRGLIRSIDDAERAGALGDTSADLLRGVVRRVPVGGLLDLIGRLSGF